MASTVESTTRRTTVYLDVQLHKALRMKSAETNRSISELINESIQHTLTEDEIDLQAFRDRADDPVISYEEMLKRLKADGKL